MYFSLSLVCTPGPISLALSPLGSALDAFVDAVPNATVDNSSPLLFPSLQVLGICVRAAAVDSARRLVVSPSRLSLCPISRLVSPPTFLILGDVLVSQPPS